jgi:RHS repeat-associated protein
MPEINFFWDPLSDNILQERDETGAVTAEYTAEPGLYGNIISQNRGGVESQFHYDAQGSNLAVTDDNQNVTDTFAYTAFGEVTERTGTTEIPFQYIGQKGYYTDGLTGQILIRRRPYEPSRARWLCVDPGQAAAFLEFAHLIATLYYVYSRNLPLSRMDPSGLRDEMMCDKCNEMLAMPPLEVSQLDRCLKRAGCEVIAKCVCCSEDAGGCAFIDKDGNIHARLCCGKHNQRVLVHEYLHALRYCQAKSTKRPLAKNCNECIREELITYICAGLCTNAQTCVESAFKSCALAFEVTREERARPKPAPGTQPCAEGEDPKAISFVGCKKDEIDSLRGKIDQLIAYVKDTYGDPPSATTDLCKTAFSVADCLTLSLPDVVPK